MAFRSLASAWLASGGSAETNGMEGMHDCACEGLRAWLGAELGASARGFDTVPGVKPYADREDGRHALTDDVTRVS